MALYLKSVVATFGGGTPGELVSPADLLTGLPAGAPVLVDGNGDVVVPLQAELYEAGAAAGAGGATGQLGVAIPGADEAGGAGGQGGGSGSLEQRVDLGGAAAGKAGTGANPDIPGAPVALGGGAAGQGGGGAAPGQAVSLGGSAAGGATAGPSQPAQVKPLAGAAAGAGGAGAAPSTSVAPVSLGGTAAGAASATASATVAAVASGPIVLHNPGFELPIGSTGSADWWADTTPPPLYGGAQVWRISSTELAGAYVAVFHLYDGDDGYDQGTPAGASGTLSVRITRATIDASSGVLGPYSMKFMYAPSDSRMLVELKAYNSGGTVLKDIQINIFGSGGAIADADTAIDNPYNTTYQRKVNVKAQLVAAGTTWANVDHVDVIFTGVTNGTGNGQLYVYLDSFATS